MNYIAQKNVFDRWCEVNYLDITAYALWHKLHALCNRCMWPEWITVDNRQLAGMLYTSEKKAMAARDELLNNGFILYRKGKKGSPNKYHLVCLYEGKHCKNDSENGSISDSINAVEPEVKTAVKMSDINKHKQKQNINKNKEKEKNIKKEKPVKHRYGEYNNVLLTDDDIERLKTKFPDMWQKWIETLSEGIELKGYTYKNHYLAILKWAERDMGRVHERQKPAADKVQKSKFNNYVDTNETDYAALEEQIMDMMLEDEG